MKKHKIINEYGAVLKKSTEFPYGIPESMLPYSKEAIKNATKVALVLADNETEIEYLKGGYILLATFIPDEEAMKAKVVSDDINSTTKTSNEEMEKYLKSGKFKDFELLIKINKRIAKEQKQLSDEINEFLKKHRNLG